MNLSFSGLDELLRQLEQLDGGIADAMDEMLKAGAAEVTAVWKREAEARGHVDTRDMIDSIAPTRPWKTRNDARGIAIYPQGNDRTGVRNATKAFWLNYGTERGIPGDGWVENADSRSESPAMEAMQAVYDRFIQKNE